MERRKLNEAEVTTAVAKLDGWAVNDKGELHKKFKFENFAEALDFVNKAGAIAEKHDHHPDITFGWGYAEFVLTTHDRGGLTEFDFAVAAEIDGIT